MRGTDIFSAMLLLAARQLAAQDGSPVEGHDAKIRLALGEQTQR